jgi:predicted methyltransferase
MSLRQIDDALAEKTRPRAHRSRDVRDKTAEVLALADIRAGQHIVDFLPFRGYFTRLFASLVGPQGHVFAAVPRDLTRIERIAKGKTEVEALAARQSNITLISGLAQAAGDPPSGVDLFWIAQNYHDLEGSFMRPVDMSRFNAIVYQVLNPGGTYVIIDHSAHSDCPHDAASHLHRIDPMIVRRQVESVGFVLESKSTLLANPADSMLKSIFRRGARYHTDRFLLKFRKPS